MVLLAQNVGMNPGEYAFIFFFQLVGDPVVGEYTWERGDELDMVGSYIQKEFIERFCHYYNEIYLPPQTHIRILS